MSIKNRNDYMIEFKFFSKKENILLIDQNIIKQILNLKKKKNSLKKKENYHFLFLIFIL
jgi:AAA+ superfamily predicted ATPase